MNEFHMTFDFTNTKLGYIPQTVMLWEYTNEKRLLPSIITKLTKGCKFQMHKKILRFAMTVGAFFILKY